MDISMIPVFFLLVRWLVAAAAVIVVGEMKDRQLFARVNLL